MKTSRHVRVTCPGTRLRFAPTATLAFLPLLLHLSTNNSINLSYAIFINYFPLITSWVVLVVLDSDVSPRRHYLSTNIDVKWVQSVIFGVNFHTREQLRRWCGKLYQKRERRTSGGSLGPSALRQCPSWAPNAKGGSKRQLLRSPASHSLFPVFGLVARSPSTTFFYPRALPRPVTESPTRFWSRGITQVHVRVPFTPERCNGRSFCVLFYCFRAPQPPRLPLLRGAQVLGSDYFWTIFMESPKTATEFGQRWKI